MQSFMSLLPILGVFVVFYLFLILPQRKKDKQTRAMIDALKTGDKIVTIGGINGKVVSVKDDNIVIETGAGNEKSTMTISKWAIRECLTIKE